MTVDYGYNGSMNEKQTLLVDIDTTDLPEGVRLGPGGARDSNGRIARQYINPRIPENSALELSSVGTMRNDLALTLKIALEDALQDAAYVAVQSILTKASTYFKNAVDGAVEKVRENNRSKQTREGNPPQQYDEPASTADELVDYFGELARNGNLTEEQKQTLVSSLEGTPTKVKPEIVASDPLSNLLQFPSLPSEPKFLPSYSEGA